MDDTDYGTQAEKELCETVSEQYEEERTTVSNCGDNTKHTPGPWRVYDNSTGVGVQSIGDRSDICTTHVTAEAYQGMCSLDSERTVDEARANAHLIASALELLEEHKAWAKNIGEALVRAMQGDYGLIDILAKTTNIEFPDGEPQLKSNAIAKAEGR